MKILSASRAFSYGGRSVDITNLKDQFADDFLSGRKPTLDDYLKKYLLSPEDRDEFIDFVLEFAILHATPLPDPLPEPSPEAYAAMMKGLQKAWEERNSGLA